VLTTAPLRFGSFCSGIGAPEVAWTRLGWVPTYFAEIEPFPCAVLARHYPGVPNLGDITNILPRAGDYEMTFLRSVSVLCAGTPCQAFSVAGLRGSLADERGNLSLVFCELVHAIDPLCVVWENVPGVLSTADNAFGCFLAGLVGEGEPLISGYGGWADAGMAIGPRRSAAWRVLDAQFFGLAQRRRRVFVVSFRTGDGLNPGAVLFEPESVQRHLAPGREAGAGVAGSLTGSLGRRGGIPDGGDTEGQLIAADSFGERDTSTCLTSHGVRLDPDTETFVCHSLGADGFDASEDGTGRGTPLVVDTLTGNGDAHSGFRDDRGLVAYQCQGSNVGPMGHLRAGNGNETGGVPFVFDWQKGNDKDNPRPSTMNVSVDQSQTLGSTRVPAVAFQERGREGGRNVETQEDLAYSLTAPAGGGRRQEMNVATPTMAVRRLTPRECERLQGFPDDYTAVEYRGKPAADGPRYRALGNSMAVPCLEWIGQRIQKVLAASATETEAA
jgi:DNA (cytosine-5)-methyltransferase 1